MPASESKCRPGFSDAAQSPTGASRRCAPVRRGGKAAAALGDLGRDSGAPRERCTPVPLGSDPRSHRRAASSRDRISETPRRPTLDCRHQSTPASSSAFRHARELQWRRSARFPPEQARWPKSNLAVARVPPRGDPRTSKHIGSVRRAADGFRGRPHTTRHAAHEGRRSRCFRSSLDARITNFDTYTGQRRVMMRRLPRRLAEVEAQGWWLCLHGTDIRATRFGSGCSTVCVMPAFSSLHGQPNVTADVLAHEKPSGTQVVVSEARSPFANRAIIAVAERAEVRRKTPPCAGGSTP